MKKYLLYGFVVSLFIITNTFALNSTIYFLQQEKDSTELSIDGPYVFYSKDSIFVKWFDRIENKIQLITKSYSITQKDKITITCKIDNNYNLPFTFSLAPKIKIPNSISPSANKIIALSDYEGNFRGLYNMLLSFKVIDKNYNWTYGKNSLVFVGDIFDRGWNVTAIIWLLYKLEQEAALAGGSVHVLIGNHESMNFWGDDRYVVNKYKMVAKELRMNLKELYSQSTEIGRWLRSKNIMEKIGPTLFVHGGISDTINKLGKTIEKLNNLARANFSLSKDERNKIGGEVKLLFGSEGPLWYRGYFQDTFDTKILDATLKLYNIKHVVVGHTIVNDIQKMFNGKLFPIDVEHTKEDDSTMKALLIEKNKFYKINSIGEKVPL